MATSKGGQRGRKPTTDEPRPESARAKARKSLPRLMSTGDARRAIEAGELKLTDNYESRPYRRGRPVYTRLTAAAAERLVGTHHDAVGGRTALKAGAELRCGSVVVRRCRYDPRGPAPAADPARGGQDGQGAALGADGSQESQGAAQDGPE